MKCTVTVNLATNPSTRIRSNCIWI